MGFLFILPLLSSLITYSVTTYISYLRSKPPKHLSGPRAINSLFGMLLGVTGSFPSASTPWEICFRKPGCKPNIHACRLWRDLNLNTASVLFGLLVAGALVLYYSGLAHLSSATRPHPSRNGTRKRSKMWVEFLFGIWIIGVPMWVTGNDEIVGWTQGTSIALTSCLVVGSTVVLAMWAKGREISRIDGRC